MPQLQARPFAFVTVDEINDTYKKGYITAAQKNDLLRRKATDTLDNVVENQGVLMAYWTQSVKHVQENWDDLVKIAQTHDPTKSSWDNVKTIGRAMMDQIGMLTAGFAAFQEVNGTKANQLALQAGASPGLAAAIAAAVETGSAMLPIGQTSRLFAKAIQKNVPEIGAALSKISGAGKAAAVAGEAATAAKATEATAKVADDIIKKGLAADGVKGVEAIGEAAKTIKEPTFYESLAAFRKDMEKLSERKAHEVTLAEAEKLGISIDDVRAMVRGQGLNEAQIAAYLKALNGPYEELKNLATRTIAGEAEAQAQLPKKLQDFFELLPNFRSAEITGGRTVEILKEQPPAKALSNLFMGWDPESMAKMDQGAATLTMAEDILGLGDKLKTLQVASAQIPKGPTFWGQVREAYTNLLLARPVTQARNFIGNSFAALNSSVEREMAGWLSIDKANGVVKGEGMKQLQGMTFALGDGISSFGEAFRQRSWADTSKLDYLPHQIPGPLGRLINIPGDALRGMDNLFKTLLRRGDIYAQALQKGSHLGLEGKALADYATRHVNVPTQEMLAHANDFALNQTFQNDLGTLGKAAQRFMQAGPLVYYFPFMKTPINLMKYAWNRTPGLQLLSHSLYEDILAGGERADMAIARLTLGSMMGQFWYSLAKQGMITGGGPVDTQLRRSWLATKQPYSIMSADGTYYPFVNIEPMTTTVNLIADFAEIENQLDDPTAEQAAMAITLSGVRDIADKSYWQTVGQLVNLMGTIRSGEEPGKQFGELLAGPVTTVASGGPLASGVARIIDPVRREARTFLDTVKSRVPVYSKELPPMRDGYGDPIMPPIALGNKWLGLISPFIYKPEETDPIKKEGARLQVKLPAFPWSTGGGKLRDDFDVRTALPGDAIPVELSAEERDRWQVIYRNILRHPETGIQSMLNSEEYKNGTWAGQHEMFMDYLAQARDGAKNALLTENIPLAKKVVIASGARYLPMIPPSQRPEIEQQVSEAVGLLDTLLPEQRDNLNKWGYLDSGEARDYQIEHPDITMTKEVTK